MDKKLILRIEKIIKYKFTNKDLLIRAFTHKSTSKDINKNYEKLEFLGDRVLGLVLADFLEKNYSNDSVGNLDKRLASLVNKERCFKIIETLDLGKFLNFAKHSSKLNTRETINVYGDLCEALIGAIYLDKGYSYAKKFILNNWKVHLNQSSEIVIDSKTKLQEFSLKNYKKLPEYKLVSSTGPSHSPVFKVSVCIEKSKIFLGEGTSKKIAEANAASKLIETLKI